MVNPLAFLYKKEVGVFHVRLAGCGGCSEVIDRWLRESRRGRVLVRECSSPRHAGLLVVSGCWTNGLGDAALEVASQRTEGCPIVAAGDCALCRGVAAELFAVQESVGAHLPVAVELPGCPLTVEELVRGVLDVGG